MKTDKVVVSIGGSILIPGVDDADFISRLSEMLKGIKDKVQIAVVVGGGRTARMYVDIAAELGGDTYKQDILGIEATRMNAQLLALALGDMPDRVSEDPEATAAASEPGKVVVMGGTVPGHTTDAVSTMVAKAMKADRVVNATSVDAVYSEDPRKNPDAVKFKDMTIEQLSKIVYSEHGAGKSSVFDPLGVKIAAENKIDIMMVNGRHLEELRKAILGEEFEGTFVNSH